MSLILNIDTSQEIAFITIAENGEPIASLQNEFQKDHAGFLQKGIKQLCSQLSLALGELSAIAVTAGPGSYTGLRVGIASAKGLCYSLEKPLINIGSLHMIAKNAANLLKNNHKEYSKIVPMIDARRMEVFAAVFDEKLNEINPPEAIILDQQSFEEDLKHQKICFTGNGSDKFSQLINHPHAFFLASRDYPLALSQLSFEHYIASNFAGLVNSQPIYVKEFYTPNT
jgi:tRNA threonylcarbamoyladenosine biosynthesis protein TsaB